MRTYLDDWKEQGLMQGLKEGRVEGRVEGATSLLLQLLDGKLGPLGLRTQNRIKRLSFPQVEQLGKALFDLRSRKDLTSWLNEHDA